MKITVAAVQVVMGRFTIPVPDPGVVRHIAFEQKQTLVMQRGQPSFEEVPVLFIEADPTAPKRNRRFAVISHGNVLETEDDEIAKWRGSGISGSGVVVHVFELLTEGSRLLS